MDWEHTSKTTTRREYGIFHLNLVRIFDRAIFANPDDVPVFSLCGGWGKSLAADVMFHELLSHLDPMDIIDGEEVRHMYLESKPKEALERDLFAHGSIDLGGGNTADASLVFINQPFAERYDAKYWQKSSNERTGVMGDFLRHSFDRERNGNVGGLIFTSSLGCYTTPMVTMSHYETDQKGQWFKDNTVVINSSRLRNCSQFQKRWVQFKESHP